MSESQTKVFRDKFQIGYILKRIDKLQGTVAGHHEEYHQSRVGVEEHFEQDLRRKSLVSSQ